MSEASAICLPTDLLVSMIPVRSSSWSPAQ